jgi:signal transduction histidine kinase
VGNKAAPVPGSVKRLRDDLLNLLAAFQYILTARLPQGADSPLLVGSNPLGVVAENVFEEAEAGEVDLSARAAELLKMPEKRLGAMISLESMLEDLQIIENSATTILNIKEDLIGPARQRKPVVFSLTDELARMVLGMGLPKGVVTAEWPEGLPPVYGDPRQIDQVFNNLVKNAWEALAGTPEPKIAVSARLDADPNFILVGVKDNGPGIPPEILEKIWVSFFTTKGGRGGTGLGLSACMEIVRQNNGKIWVESQVGHGATFYVLLPVSSSQPEEA